ncbi:hypothetical protein SEA_DELAGARZA_70 [Microbacterium phage DelaGarza]|nr:hypothetical protein SEA_DELAGARZA_70 [Microbacterium phage DelaGarza]
MAADFMAGIERHRSLSERGLRDQTFIAAEEPRVVPQERILPLPDYLLRGDEYGTVEDFIGYLRQVNGIPGEAEQAIERDEPRMAHRVRFTWWEVTAPFRMPGRESGR